MKRPIDGANCTSASRMIYMSDISVPYSGPYSGLDSYSTISGIQISKTHTLLLWHWWIERTSSSSNEWTGVVEILYY